MPSCLFPELGVRIAARHVDSPITPGYESGEIPTGDVPLLTSQAQRRRPTTEDGRRGLPARS